MNPIMHFDLPADDLDRAKTFYEKLFGWKFMKPPGWEGPDYYFIETGTIGPLRGGMGERGAPDQRITNYVGVDSADEYAGKVEELGGKIAQPKMTVPGFGYLVVCLDTEGNTFGLWQDDKEAK